MTPTQRQLSENLVNWLKSWCLCRMSMPMSNVYAECRIKSVQLSGQQQCACVHFSAHSYFKGKR